MAKRSSKVPPQPATVTRDDLEQRFRALQDGVRGQVDDRKSTFLTAAGIIAPILASLSVAPVVIGLAIASGAMFALHVNSNFFWMFKALLGLSTKGTLKTLTLATSVASIVSLPMVLVVSLFA